jgi:hypothetical protein
MLSSFQQEYEESRKTSGKREGNLKGKWREDKRGNSEE